MTRINNNSTTPLAFVPARADEVPADFDHPHLPGEVFHVYSGGKQLGTVWTISGAYWFSTMSRWSFDHSYRPHTSRAAAAETLRVMMEIPVTYYAHVRNLSGRMVPMHLQATQIDQDRARGTVKIRFCHPATGKIIIRTVNAVLIGTAMAKGTAA